METILLDNEIILYKTEYISKVPKEELLLVLGNQIQKNPNTTTDAYVLNSEITEIDDIRQFAIDKCIEIAKEQGIESNEIWSEFWINRIKAKEPVKGQFITTNIDEAVYHIHTELNMLNDKFIPNYTIVYYIQMPDNLINNDAALLIKNKKDRVYIFNPCENDFIILNGDTPHAPLGAPNSNKDRIVIAGNIGFLNVKKQKSIF